MSKLLCLSALAFALASAAAQAGPSMAALWASTSLPLEECKARAEQAARAAGFRELKTLAFSVFAERGDYAVMARCAPEKQAVFIAVAGPRTERANEYAEAMAKGFAE